MNQTPWLGRKFNFDFPSGVLPNVLERLSGTPARIREMVGSLGNDELEYKPGDKWSIKEHVGHLSDLEDLHEGRIDDFLASKEILRAADMTNAATKKANHNLSSIHSLIESFSGKRAVFVARLGQLSDEMQEFRALHPRLKILMRPVDMAYFTAEHDDHHLAAMRMIIRVQDKP